MTQRRRLCALCEERRPGRRWACARAGESTRRSAGGRARMSKAIGSSLEIDIGQSDVGPQ
eukprot:5246603-Pleurochrysis_carterae.AAC.1